MGTRFNKDWEKYEAIMEAIKTDPSLKNYLREMDIYLLQAQEVIDSFRNVLREVL